MAIISLSGRIGSGKDTIGAMIQYLIWKDKKSKGELTMFVEGKGWRAFEVTDYYVGWTRKKFAAKLKQIASILIGVPIQMWEDQEFKKQLMPDEWDVWLIESDSKYPHIWPINVYIEWLARGRPYIRRKLAYREFLQLLGTNAIRDIIHPNTWVNALFVDYNEGMRGDTIGELLDDQNKEIASLPNWIITDTRFPNEAQAVKERGGIMVKVIRNGTIRRYTQGKIGDEIFIEEPFDSNNPQHVALLKAQEIKSGLHLSETALDDYKFDYTIDNSGGSVDELIPKVEEMLKHFKIL